jgi:hypothetical protein
VQHCHRCVVLCDTDALWTENVVPNNNSIGMCMGGDVFIQNEETDDCLIKFLSMNNEVNDIGPIVQSVGDECKLPTKVTEGGQTCVMNSNCPQGQQEG